MIDNLSLIFKNTPQRFFTEYDIHSNLYRIAEDEINKRGISFFKTRNGYLTSLVHHEYPTPFRCDMKRYKFRVASEEERTMSKGKYKRGHYDLVVLNPDFVLQNDLVVVTGKNYQLFRKAMENVTTSPLLWVCEVVFFPQLAAIPKNATEIVRQDALKVKATLNHKVSQDVNFCEMGSILVSSSLSQGETVSLRREILKLGKECKLKIFFITATA